MQFFWGKKIIPRYALSDVEVGCIMLMKWLKNFGIYRELNSNASHINYCLQEKNAKDLIPLNTKHADDIEDRNVKVFTVFE